jgi:hypothetical protein
VPNTNIIFRLRIAGLITGRGFDDLYGNATGRAPTVLLSDVLETILRVLGAEWSAKSGGRWRTSRRSQALSESGLTGPKSRVVRHSPKWRAPAAGTSWRWLALICRHSLSLAGTPAARWRSVFC